MPKKPIWVAAITVDPLHRHEATVVKAAGDYYKTDRSFIGPNKIPYTTQSAGAAGTTLCAAAYKRQPLKAAPPLPLSYSKK